MGSVVFRDAVRAGRSPKLPARVGGAWVLDGAPGDKPGQVIGFH